MAIWPFRRKQSEEDYAEGMQEELPVTQQPASNLPEEVQEYYESGRQSRMGVAWLLGLGTLVATVLLAMVLFFGGRWIYRAIAGNDEPGNTTQIGEDQKKQDEQNKQNSGNQNQQQPNNQPSQPTPTPAPAPAPAPTPAPAPAPSPAPTPSPAPAPSTGGKTPNTGPGEVAAVIAVATGIVSSAGYYIVQLRREN